MRDLTADAHQQKPKTDAGAASPEPAPDPILASREAGASLPPPSAQPAQVLRALDEDRWLASRFASPVARRRLEALYLMAAELARAGDGAKDITLAQIRLTWWLTALEAMVDGGSAAQPPSVRALASVHQEVGFDRAVVLGMAQARHAELGDAPFATWAELDAFIDATAGGLVVLAMQALEPQSAISDLSLQLARQVGRAWGYTGLVRAFGYWRARGRCVFPLHLMEHLKLGAGELIAGAVDHRVEAGLRAMIDRAQNGYEQARRLGATAPVGLFPAYGYVALAPAYLRAAKANLTGPIAVPLWRRQTRLLQCAMRGKV
jgi:phytoene synthase